MGFTGFYWVLPSFNGFYRVLLGFTGFQLVLLGSTGFYGVLLGFTGFFWLLNGFCSVSLGFSGFFWVLLGFTGFYWVLLGFADFYWVSMDCTGFYWVILGLLGSPTESQSGNGPSPDRPMSAKSRDGWRRFSAIEQLLMREIETCANCLLFSFGFRVAPRFRRRDSFFSLRSFLLFGFLFLFFLMEEERGWEGNEGKRPRHRFLFSYGRSHSICIIEFIYRQISAEPPIIQKKRLRRMNDSKASIPPAMTNNRRTKK